MSELDLVDFFPEVLQAVPDDNHNVYAYLNDGSVRCYDVKPLIRPGTVFWQLNDINVFKTKITVLNSTVAWDIEGNMDEYKCIDIDPFAIFNSPEVVDPLELSSEPDEIKGA